MVHKAVGSGPHLAYRAIWKKQKNEQGWNGGCQGFTMIFCFNMHGHHNSWQLSLLSQGQREVVFLAGVSVSTWVGPAAGAAQHSMLCAWAKRDCLCGAMVGWLNVSKRVKHFPVRPSFLSPAASHALATLGLCQNALCVSVGCCGKHVQQRGCRLCNFKKLRCLSNISVVQGKWWDITAKTCIVRKRKVRKGASLSPLEDSIHLTGWAALDFGLGCFSGSLWRLFFLETLLYPSSSQVVC